MKVTKKTKLDKLLKSKKAEKILMEQGLPCVFCPYAKYEAGELGLGEVCKRYGIDADKLIEILNKKL
jgi:hypothetical protein